MWLIKMDNPLDLSLLGDYEIRQKGEVLISVDKEKGRVSTIITFYIAKSYLRSFEYIAVVVLRFFLEIVAWMSGVHT